MTDAIKPGDIVRHGPTGEEWVVAAADPSTGRLMPCGWPESSAAISDCTIVKRATPQDSRALHRNLTGERRRMADRVYGHPNTGDDYTCASIVVVVS